MESSKNRNTFLTIAEETKENKEIGIREGIQNNRREKDSESKIERDREIENKNLEKINDQK